MEMSIAQHSLSMETLSLVFSKKKVTTLILLVSAPYGCWIAIKLVLKESILTTVMSQTSTKHTLLNNVMAKTF